MNLTRQDKARSRNWTKARVVGLVAGMSYYSTIGILTPEEGEIIYKIQALKMRLLEDWEDNSVKLGMNVKNRDITG